MQKQNKKNRKETFIAEWVYGGNTEWIHVEKRIHTCIYACFWCCCCLFVFGFVLYWQYTGTRTRERERGRKGRSERVRGREREGEKEGGRGEKGGEGVKKGWGERGKERERGRGERERERERERGGVGGREREREREGGGGHSEEWGRDKRRKVPLFISLTRPYFSLSKLIPVLQLLLLVCCLFLFFLITFLLHTHQLSDERGQDSSKTGDHGANANHGVACRRGEQFGREQVYYTNSWWGSQLPDIGQQDDSPVRRWIKQGRQKMGTLLLL